MNSIFPASAAPRPAPSPLEDLQLKRTKLSEGKAKERKRALDFKDHRHYGMKGEWNSSAGW